MKDNPSFGTKAETLLYFRKKLTKARICDSVVFSVDQWRGSRQACLDEITEKFSTTEVIIRSSAAEEDSSEYTMAGYFLSVPNIPGSSLEQLATSIEQVITSYARIDSFDSLRCQVLVQPMVADVSMSGVVFTHELNTGSPYYVVNYDDESGKTDSITSGSSAPNKTLIIYRNALDKLKSSRIRRLIEAVQEIEECSRLDTLDIEFAINLVEDIYILQIRPMTTQANWNSGLALEIEDCIRRMAEFVESRQGPIPAIHGKRSIFGQMPDWNPAEIIGTAPSPLSFALYRYLITDKTWRRSRAEMGYAEPAGAPLMVSLSGQPYIDVRMSFHSFLPATLSWQTGEKLVNAWLDRLEQHHELHDKVEFEVAITAHAFDFKDEVERLIPGVLSREELSEFQIALLTQTDGFLNGTIGSLSEALAKIEILNSKRQQYSKGSGSFGPIMIGRLLDLCIEFGTQPFSILARHAFVSRSLLRSLVSRQILTEEDLGLLFASIPTVATDLLNDVTHVRAGNMTHQEFKDRYGHLRPGTYDILSLRYDQRQDFIQREDEYPVYQPETRATSFSFKAVEKNISSLMKEQGFSAGPTELFSYIKESIQGREYAKFVFTKVLSDTLEVIADWAEDIGLSREEVSFLTVYEILDTETNTIGRTLEHELRQLAQQAMRRYEITKAVHLPHLIASQDDVMVVPLMRCRPNFITRNRCRARFLFLDGHDQRPPDMTGRIIIIERADPGFDWIFTQNIAGLVTKFGGANSHMAIRCAELNLPAAIGCGEQIFDRLLKANSIELDCSKGIVEPIWA